LSDARQFTLARTTSASTSLSGLSHRDDGGRGAASLPPIADAAAIDVANLDLRKRGHTRAPMDGEYHRSHRDAVHPHAAFGHLLDLEPMTRHGDVNRAVRQCFQSCLGAESPTELGALTALGLERLG
jgi:hypothetical protein